MTSPMRTPTATSASASASLTSCTSTADVRRPRTTRSSAPVRAPSRRPHVPAGRARETGNPLDVALEGEGFLKVKLADGRQALTRDGGLHDRRPAPPRDRTGGLIQPQIKIPEDIRRAQTLDRPGRHGHGRRQEPRQDRARQGPLAAEPRVRRRERLRHHRPLRQRRRRSRRDASSSRARWRAPTPTSRRR